jgi:lipopolysaccharide transport system ATP-binding protein
MKHRINSSPQPDSSIDGDVVVKVSGVAKKFCRDLKRALFYGVLDISSELTNLRQAQTDLRSKEFWALKDVCFELRRGQALGLIGKNGSGKTTLLRLISGLIKPDAGFVVTQGRLAPLIALGAGFNPILTGRENIYTIMSVLGLSKSEIDARFAAVVEFAEIEAAIDAPVQSYSSGMAARLGFASAIHTYPDVLLIDEVLSVGDIKFRQKCRRKLQDLRQNGTALILVSHNPQVVLNVCSESIYLSQGRLVCAGNTDMVMRRYEQDLFLNLNRDTEGLLLVSPKVEPRTTGVEIRYLAFRDKEGQISKCPRTGDEITVCMGYMAHEDIKKAGIVLIIREMASENDVVLFFNSYNDDVLLHILPGKHEAQVFFPSLGLRAGTYTMRVMLRRNNLDTLDFIEAFNFSVTGEKAMGRSLFYQPRQWRIVSNQSLDIS